MEEDRITYVGWTDYSVASLELIVSDLKKDFHAKTVESIERLGELKKEVMDNFDRLDDPDEIIGYIEFCIRLFKSFEYDFKRILDEIPQGIQEKHIDIIKQIHERCRHEDKISVLGFKRDHIVRKMKDESLRYLVDEIYIVTRNITYDNKVLLFSLSNRLRTFIGSKPSEEDKKKPKKYAKRPFPTPPEALWDKLYLTFESNDRVKIEIEDMSDEADFAELGFTDKRSGDSNLLWGLLLTLAEYRGEYDYSSYNIKQREKLKKNMQRLKKELIDIFGIREDPFVSKSGCYKTSFNIKKSKGFFEYSGKLEPDFYQEGSIQEEDIAEDFKGNIRKRIDERKKKIAYARKEELEGKKKKD